MDGKTPNAYYSSFTAKELISCLKSHIESGVPTSDFLLMAILKADGAEEEIVKELLDDSEEEFTLYLMNILSDLNSDKAYSRYMEFILSDYPESIKELATERTCVIGNIKLNYRAFSVFRFTFFVFEYIAPY